MIRRSSGIVAATLLVSVACQEGTPIEVSGASSSRFALRPVSGDSQRGEVGRLLEEFLVFRVIDAEGRPMEGLRVEWEVVAGGGSVSGKRHETDAAGVAAGNFTLGPEPGEHVARAIVRDSLTIAFTAFAIPASPGEEPTESAD